MCVALGLLRQKGPGELGCGPQVQPQARRRLHGLHDYASALASYRIIRSEGFTHENVIDRIYGLMLNYSKTHTQWTCFEIIERSHRVTVVAMVHLQCANTLIAKETVHRDQLKSMKDGLVSGATLHLDANIFDASSFSLNHTDHSSHARIVGQFQLNFKLQIHNLGFSCLQDLPTLASSIGYAPKAAAKGSAKGKAKAKAIASSRPSTGSSSGQGSPTNPKKRKSKFETQLAVSATQSQHFNQVSCSSDKQHYYVATCFFCVCVCFI